MPKNEAKALISLDAKPFVAGAKLAMDASKKMASVMKNAMGVATGVVVGGAALQGINKLAGGIQDLTSGGINLAASMADLAAETGMAADEALKYDFALKNGLSNKAAEQLMGKAAKNIGSTAEVFRNLKIRLSAIWMNMQGVFAKLASFFTPVVDQLLGMAESIDWDEWIESAKQWITPIRDGILAVIQLVKERKIWEVAGKVMELGLGYEGGVAAFLTFAAVYGLDLLTLSRAVRATTSNEAWSNACDVWRWAVSKRRTLGLDEEIYVACEVLKRAWRDAHPATEHLWKITGEQVRNAIANPGVAFPVGQHIKVQRDGAWLRARLPSGRCLCYLKPSVADDGQISYYGVSPYSRQWTTIKTYGGKTVENLTQAFARDILVWNQEHVEEAGYEIVCDVHDENLTEVPDTPEYSVERLCGLMATPLPWAPGMPLAVAGAEMKRYHKGD